MTIKGLRPTFVEVSKPRKRPSFMPRDCICDPMDFAALGHMLNCQCYVDKKRK